MSSGARLSLSAVLLLVACSGTAGGSAPSGTLPATQAATVPPVAVTTSGPERTPQATSDATLSPSPVTTSMTPSAATTAPASPPATATASAGPSPTATAGGSPSPSPARALGWTQLAIEGETPPAREDHTWTANADGTLAYLFGGRADGEALGDLWVYDLTVDRWERLEPSGAAPAARFGHTGTWVPSVGLVVWSGQAGTDFFGDLWAYDPGEGAWRELPAGGDVPAARYGACADVGPDRRLWISHGFTFEGRFDDTRAYDFADGRWVDLTPRDRPALRCLHDCLWTADGRFLLYAGQTNGAAALADLWALEPSPEVDGEATPRWTELGGGPPPRNLYAVAEVGREVFVFGGSGTERARLDDLWVLDTETDRWRALEPESEQRPEGRSGATFVTDAQRGRLLLFGGETAERALDDVWGLALP